MLRMRRCGIGWVEVGGAFVGNLDFEGNDELSFSLTRAGREREIIKKDKQEDVDDREG